MRTNASTSPVRKVFVATLQTQGRRKNDFCFAKEGELLRFTTECDGERVDGPCGCRRALSGMESQKATTTFTVQETSLSKERFAETLAASYAAAGFGAILTPEFVREEAAELLRLASSFPIGCVIEKRGNSMRTRT